MEAQNFVCVSIHEGARPLAKMLLDKLAVPHLAQEADALAVGAGLGWQGSGGRQLSHRRLGQWRQWEHAPGQLCLREVGQKVRLVLHGVRGCRQHRPLRSVRHRRIVPRRNAVEPPWMRLLQILKECAKLHPGIAHDIGVGRVAGTNLGDAVSHDPIPILLTQGHRLQRHTRLLTHLSAEGKVGFPWAGVPCVAEVLYKPDL
mmetsp:Transcript_4517/g.12995  ORF Transcript_4517/g.12995 Transcript_4517/m.12995 type:complete len:202 (-) Transcript_4517:769-1374(-)